MMKITSLLIRNKLFLFVVLCGVLILPTFLSLRKVDNAAESNKAFDFLTRNDSLVMWSSDFHISPIADIKHLLKDYHVRIIDKSLSGHCHLMNTCEKNLRIIDKQNGIRLSPCANQLRRDFYKAYVYDVEFNSADALLCNHATSMCELFLPFNKPLIVIASTRYEIGRHDAESWKRWNENLKRIAANPRNVVAANNQYDVDYIKYFTGIENVQLLPNFCGYVTPRYAPTKREILLGPSRGVNYILQSQLRKDLESFNSDGTQSKAHLEIPGIRDLYPVHHEYSDLAAHPAIIILPYQVSFMSLFEFYRMEIPLFIPSPSLLAQWHMKHGVLNERTWSTVFGSPSGRSPLPRHVNASCSQLSDPNNEFDQAAVLEWIQTADFYVWPHITQFNSFEELFKLLTVESTHEVDLMRLKDISARMHTFNVEEEARIRESWVKILAKVHNDKSIAHSALPQDVDTALSKLYGYTLSKDNCDTEIAVI